MIESSNQELSATESTSTETLPVTSEQPADTTIKEAVKSDNPAEESDSFTDQKFDPNEVAKWTPQEIEKRYKAFQADYTKKTQSVAESRKKYEAERATLEAEIATSKKRSIELQAVAADIIRDPSKLEAYRKVYGKQLGIEENSVAKEAPNLQTVEDLVKYVEDKEKNITEKLEQKFRQERIQEQMAVSRESRWTRAVEQNKADPVFANEELQELVVQFLQSPRRDYIARYQRGDITEDQAIKEGIAAVKKAMGPFLQSAQQDALKSFEKKKKASTEMPTKALATEPGRKLSREEIISRVEQMVPRG